MFDTVVVLILIALALCSLLFCRVFIYETFIEYRSILP